jgi:hypothetical protein
MFDKRNVERTFTRRNLTGSAFAERAKDLGALRDAVVDAANVGAGLWISYLFALFYFAIATGAVTHRDLLLESPVKLPFLNVELPLKAFFTLGPLVFLVVHTYVLLHFVLLAAKICAFHLELRAQIPGDDARTRLRRQLPSNIFVQSLAGPREVRTGIIGFLLRLIIEISLVVGPIALLILFELQFLPFHGEWVTMWHRLAVVIDLVLLWILWPRIARVETVGLGLSDFKGIKIQALLAMSILPGLLAVTIATFPGEWLEETVPAVRLIPTTRGAWTLPSVQAIQTAGSGWATLHELLVAGGVNLATRGPRSLWSNVLVLPNFELGDRQKSDAEASIAISSKGLSLRNRRLEGAVLLGAHLRKFDFTAANLQGAFLQSSDLREARFCDDSGIPQRECADLRGAHLTYAKLEGAVIDKANLQGARLDWTELQGASLFETKLQDADLQGASLEGAVLDFADLEGASLVAANMQGASLVGIKVRLDKERVDGAFGYDGVQPKSDERHLMELLQVIGCDPSGAPYVIRQLVGTLYQRFPADSPRPSELAGYFLDETKCFAARGLPDSVKFWLMKVRDSNTRIGQSRAGADGRSGPRK